MTDESESLPISPRPGREEVVASSARAPEISATNPLVLGKLTAIAARMQDIGINFSFSSCEKHLDVPRASSLEPEGESLKVRGTSMLASKELFLRAYGFATILRLKIKVPSEEEEFSGIGAMSVVCVPKVSSNEPPQVLIVESFRDGITVKALEVTTSVEEIVADYRSGGHPSKEEIRQGESINLNPDSAVAEKQLLKGKDHVYFPHTTDQPDPELYQAALRILEPIKRAFIDQAKQQAHRRLPLPKRILKE